MDSKINGVAVVILPPGLSKEEVQVLFSSILGKLEAIHPEYKQNGGFLTILEPNDLFRVVNPVNAEIATLADNLVVEFGEPADPVHFATKFVCAYYGPKDLVNHDVVTTIHRSKRVLQNGLIRKKEAKVPYFSMSQHFAKHFMSKTKKILRIQRLCGNTLRISLR